MEKLIIKAEKLQPIVTKSTDWVNTWLSNGKKEKSYDRLVGIRRQINKIKIALSENPASAVYGESQVGKSYLIKNLLSTKGGTFTILDNSSSQEYDFLADINPKGGGVEATSVVTRFSTKVNIPNSAFPILVKLLSVKDIGLFLIDSCFNELKDSIVPLSVEEINQQLIDLERFCTSSQSVLTEDDIYDMRDYLNEFMSSHIAVNNLKDSHYWRKVPKLIAQLDESNWYKVFSIVWSNNESFNNIFNTLIKELSNLRFSSKVYCNFEAVLRKYGTILDVNRLKQLTGNSSAPDATDGFKPSVDLFVEVADGHRKLSIEKSYLCALASEVVFKVNPDLEDHKPFLKKLDLLDFPGARGRVELNEDTIRNDMGSVLLRGKVAYMFNKYSSEYLISNLIFCNSSQQSDVTFIPRLLNNWISKYIGENPEAREDFMKSSTVPPLFIVYTWFNSDLAYSSFVDRDKNSLSMKWTKRFDRIFVEDIVSEKYDWHKNWSSSQPFFKNMYMLRDFHKSEELSNIYSGYEKYGEEVERQNPTKYPNYWNDLENTFVNYPFVRNHFDHPQKVWDESATKNNDGSEPIIKNLTISTEGNARIVRFQKILDKLHKDAILELEKHHHSDEGDKHIIMAVTSASKIQLDLDTTFGRDPYFFGKLMKKFLINEGEVFNYYKRLLANIQEENKTDISEHAAIRLSNPTLSPKNTFDENVEILVNNYNMTREEVLLYFKEKNINLHELFNGGINQLKSNSQFLATSLIDYWKKLFLNPEKFEWFASNGLSPTSLDDLLSNMKLIMDKHDVADKMASEMRAYVDRIDKIDAAENMLADISAATLNNFINSMGVDFLPDSEMDNIKQTNEDNQLGLNFDHNEPQSLNVSPEYLVSLFETMDDLPKILNSHPINKDALQNLPGFSQYSKWKSKMKTAFVANCDIPQYDILANNEIGQLIENLTDEA
ncbi:virulence factor SrfC family protein [Portibacter lacus]|uniref:Uncharacterized protein n=1 Tax=Portibacter lacus TaxID=1099794 RepID=A0AA37SL12_9BACT|nr:virulence factor SrfC family protein [Portibacter lacus]GLR15880.1 hypothetical protein GCM10007940_04950 [Portibacter lacus]